MTSNHRYHHVLAENKGIPPTCPSTQKPFLLEAPLSKIKMYMSGLKW